ncbi:ABC transporter permease [Streptomyces sp. NPDC088354]|uniref:ABC transporter permease n=1 Tax=unclassified Streptomyces TaxID=2593676 RepID=UPI0029BA2B47|nr:ABC transporter permease [Streptomyces sp. MI02-7b]MDX3073127.1 ABC transporter permease [Streptomyces sp. MI02-7b]
MSDTVSIRDAHPLEGEHPLPERHRHRHVPGPQTDAPPSRPGMTGAQAVVKPVFTVLIIGLAFVSVFLAAFHTPTAHRLPVAVAASDSSAALFDVRLQRLAPEAFQIDRYPDEASARQAVEHRQAYAAYLSHGGKPRIVYAGANGPAVSALVAPLAAVPHGDGHKIPVVDILPLSDGDSRGLSVFYASFGLVLAGFLFGQVTYQVAPRLSFGQRMLSLTLFAVVGGVATALIACTAFGAIPGSFLGIMGVVTLMAGAVAAATIMLIRTFGPIGVLLGSIFMLVMGNATSGGVLPPDFLPGWLEPLASVMPAGVGVRALDGLAYFHHDGLTRGVVILSVWIAVCVGAVYLLDRVAASTGIAHAAHR